ncbi:MAG: dockerin type I domain-containing protein, partial [candidate division Zixibacteria bacterium]|nr:dockerin type I domain-containing protein [candidate division Zixibacteria bacterium]
NDEPLRGLALALEWDGSAALQFDFNTTGCTDRINNIDWLCTRGNHVNGVNPDTFLFYSWQSNPYEVPPLSPGRDALVTVGFVPQSAGTATFRLVSWMNGSESMLVTEDRAAILPVFYGGNITVIPYLAGDPNHDGIINTSDVVYLINYLFIGGPQPIPLESGDATCEGDVNVSDVIYLINYLFIGGPPPSC